MREPPYQQTFRFLLLGLPFLFCCVPDLSRPCLNALSSASAPATAVTHFTPAAPPALPASQPVAQRLRSSSVLPCPACLVLSSLSHQSLSLLPSPALSLSPPLTSDLSSPTVRPRPCSPSTHYRCECGRRGLEVAPVPGLGAWSAMAGRLMLALPILLFLLLVGELQVACLSSMLRPFSFSCALVSVVGNAWTARCLACSRKKTRIDSSCSLVLMFCCVFLSIFSGNVLFHCSPFLNLYPCTIFVSFHRKPRTEDLSLYLQKKKNF